MPNPNGPPHQLPSLYPPYEGPKQPAWLAYDKKVLCFFGYFQETLQDVHLAPYQIRKVKIYFYMDDGTIQVSEPRTDNSGLPQGCIVGRQKIPRQAPCQHEFLSLLDLNVARTVQIFDRVYSITGCDLSTRHFLNRLGITVSDPVDIPTDPSTELRRRMELSKQPKKPCVKIQTLKQFLENDRKVLRFNGFWDDRGTEFGDVRNLEIYYFLADDTIQIKELLGTNSGRDSGRAMFIRRHKIPKDFTGIPTIGQATPITILNVLGSKKTRYIPDSLGFSDKNAECYKDCDLSIGATLNIYGRAVVVMSCDDFTQEFYRTKYGIEDFTPIQKPYESSDFKICSTSIDDRQLPPFNGWGTHEDSEGNCKTVEPKPPAADFNKFIKLDKYLLRFGAKMISTNFKENLERVFIITYFLSDETVSVYELGVRNSGFNCGNFFKRAKCFLPNQEWLSDERPKIYLPENFYLGSTVILNDFKFHIVTADEFALSYMEQNPQQFPYSNIDKIMSKIRENLRSNFKDFVARHMDKVCHAENISLICYEALKSALIEVLGNGIVEHEIITLCRYFSAEQKTVNVCEREKVRSVIHMEIIRHLWNDLDRLQEYLYHLEPKQCDFITERKLISAIRGSRIPINIELTENLFSV